MMTPVELTALALSILAVAVSIAKRTTPTRIPPTPPQTPPEEPKLWGDDLPGDPYRTAAVDGKTAAATSPTPTSKPVRILPYSDERSTFCPWCGWGYHSKDRRFVEVLCVCPQAADGQSLPGPHFHYECCVGLGPDTAHRSCGGLWIMMAKPLP